MTLDRMIFLVLPLAGLFHVSPVLAQETVSPYPGAVPLVADQEFQLFQALAAAAAARVSAEDALATFALSSFTIVAPADSVAGSLAVGAVEFHQEVVANPDSLVAPFLASLAPAELDDLANAIGSELSGSAYREALVTGLEEEMGELVDYHFIAHEHEDGSLTYYEVHRPYFDLGMLQWVDATRIRVIRLPWDNR